VTRLPLAARLYIATVIGAAGVLLIVRLPQVLRPDQPLLFAALLAVSSLCAALKVNLPLTAGGSTMSLSYAVDFAALLVLGPDKAMLVAGMSALSQCSFNSRERNPVHRTVFSVASLLVTVQGAGLVYQLLGGQPGAIAVTTLASPLVGASIVYFLLNTGLVATAIALSTRQRALSVWHTNFLWSAPGYFVGAATAALAAAVVIRAGYWVLPFTFAPLYLTYRTYKVYMGRVEDQQRHVTATSELHLATIEALARAIDAKDQIAQTHVRRVQAYAVGLARAVGLETDAIEAVKTASLLRDIGKLAVPEHILSKPGPLTDEEFQKIRIHPQVGAEIIAAVPFPYPVAPLILSHHERWDGRGYPQGLCGDDIPIGARILTIVDYYDAVTSERPYHKALTHDAALALLRHESGRALDPRLVNTFIKVLPELMEHAAAEERQARSLATPAQVERGTTARGLVPEGAPQTAFDNIALAHREIYALYEIAQALGTRIGVADTAALISSKLLNLVPWSACALFLYDAERSAMTCRYATGLDVHRLLNATIANGLGLSGWVARNRRTLVNANPSASFEAAGVESRTELKSALVCPLFTNNMFLGALALYHVEANHYTEDHRRLVERIAEQAGAVIHNSVVFEQTQEDSLTDPLTELPNRRSMFVHLSRELARAERLHAEAALIVMDVDDFKSINDTYGHHVGDQALRAIARALSATLRPYDLCVRYAGDEFIVLLTACSREMAEARRRELQQRVAAIAFEVRPGDALALGVSAGTAVFPHDGTSYETLLAVADQHMYRDKKARRQARADASSTDPATTASSSSQETDGLGRLRHSHV
jgi:diguanylate cyclase (GGDEF)-like protein